MSQVAAWASSPPQANPQFTLNVKPDVVCSLYPKSYLFYVEYNSNRKNAQNLPKKIKRRFFVRCDGGMGRWDGTVGWDGGMASLLARVRCNAVQ